MEDCKTDFHEIFHEELVPQNRPLSLSAHPYTCKSYQEHMPNFTHDRSACHSMPKQPRERLSEERHAGVGHGGVVLIRNAPIIAENLAFFGLDQSQKAIDW